jgi:hypothetical protein
MVPLLLIGKFNGNGNIMRPSKYSVEELIELFEKEKVLTLPELKRALGTDVKMTVFRKLKMVPYLSSYSHAGKYYTLHEIADYSDKGLWSFGEVHFSKYGSLKDTIEALVCASEAGYFASELQSLLHVAVYKPLSALASSGTLFRQQFASEYLYLSPAKKELQLENRKQMLEISVSKKRRQQVAEFASSEVQEALHLFLAQLNENQRRLYAGFESMKLGYGGDTIMAEITGMNIKTISRGRQELRAHDITPERVRKAGGGRHPLEKKRKS